MYLFGVRWTGGVPRLTEHFLSALCEERRERISKLRQADDVWRSLIGDLLLLCILHRCYGIRPSDVQLRTNAYGKPILASNEDVHFNISHSGEWIVLACDAEPIGVDVEQVRPVKLDIANRFFAPSEIAALRRLPDTKRDVQLIEQWTRKESYIKYRGTGLHMPLHAFAVMWRGGVWKIDTPTGEESCHIVTYRLGESYRLSVCTHRPKPVTRFVRIPLEAVLERVESLTANV